VLSTGRARGLLVGVDDLAAARVALTDAGIAATVDGGRIRVDLPADAASSVTRALADRGIYLHELRVDQADLETVFLDLTRDPGPGL
jgi:hypothetical protein